MHAPYILSADDLADFSGIYRKPSILAADDFLGACCRKAMTPQKLWILLFLQTNARKRRSENASKRKQTRANVDKRNKMLTAPFMAVSYSPSLQSPYLPPRKGKTITKFPSPVQPQECATTAGIASVAYLEYRLSENYYR